MLPFEGFEEKRVSIAGSEVEVFARVGGQGPPLLLLHGFPQTHRQAVPLYLSMATKADWAGYGDM